MSYYVNPPNESKERFLARVGIPLTESEVRNFNFTGDYLPVCLVDNFMFTSAGIAYCVEEARAFLWPDTRKKVWYKVAKKHLTLYLPEDLF